MNAYDRETMRKATRINNMAVDEIINEFRASGDPITEALARHVEDAGCEIAGLEAEINQLGEQIDAPCEVCAEHEAALEKIEDAHQDALDQKDEEIAHLNTRIEEFANEAKQVRQQLKQMEDEMTAALTKRLDAIENTLARIVLMMEAQTNEPVEKSSKPKLVEEPATPGTEDEPEYALDDVREHFLKAVDVVGKDAAKKLVLDAAPGAKKLPEVAPEYFPAVIDALKAACRAEAA